LTKVQRLLENGTSLRAIRDMMIAEAFYRALKMAWKELKGLVTISLSAAGGA
jgi:hypothetical protein